MTLFEARQKAELDYKQAKREYDAKPTQRNADRVKIKQRLLEGLQKWLVERNYGVKNA
jgi:hypothetical protein